ncbi:MAG: sulfur oxidation c-type cytochrome SoxX [Thiobacillaceae bacterium]|nr:sulfur oxidation c-type cytochrome SoxX [Thiobacillaceae bacterium]
MNRKPISLLATLLMAVAGAAAAGPKDKDIHALVDKYIAESFLPGENQDLSRLKQDETIRTCNQYRDKPPEKLVAAINERETKSIRYPDSGKLMGDWKKGEKLYAMGFAYRIGVIEPDDPKRDRGGNCYACHGADPKEVAFGTIGPSLTGYGKLRGTSDDIVKYTYEKIYNAQAFTACSQMPRLGHNGVLSPEKIADITAYLLSPESPVNK